MQHSRGQAELYKAFAKMQAEFENPTKDNDTGEGYKTAPLKNFIGEVRDKGKKYGLSFMQDLGATETGYITLSTRIMHQSGQWIQSSNYLVMPKDSTPEERGKTIFSAKKNSLSAIMGLVGEEEVETGRGNKSFFDSAAERRAAKKDMVDALALVDSQDSLDQFQDKYEDLIGRFEADCPDYIEDVKRDLRILVQTLDMKKDNLKNKI